MSANNIVPFPKRNESADHNLLKACMALNNNNKHKAIKEFVQSSQKAIDLYAADPRNAFAYAESVYQDLILQIPDEFNKESLRLETMQSMNRARQVMEEQGVATGRWDAYLSLLPNIAKYVGIDKPPQTNNVQVNNHMSPEQVKNGLKQLGQRFESMGLLRSADATGSAETTGS